MMGELSKELGFSFLRCGKVLVGNSREDMQNLERTLKQGQENGSRDLQIIGEDRLHELVPCAVGKFAMYSPWSGVLDPFGYTIALAENAAENGVSYFLGREVKGIHPGEDGIYVVETSREKFAARWVINSAGLGCGKISEMLGISDCRVIGSKGDYIILDPRTGEMLPMPVYPVPSNTYMGIHVTNTTEGNVIVGPNAENVTDFSYYGVLQKNLDYLAESASRIWPHIKKKDIIRTYSGILPKWVDENGVIQDFRIEIRDDIAPRAVNLIGIESPGLTAAVPIARYVIELMREREKFEENPVFTPRREAPLRLKDLTEREMKKRIAEDPAWGELVCRCLKVSKAEILRAIHNPLGVSTLTGVKYRTRSMMGRCQGGYCQMRIVSMLEEELGLRETEIRYDRENSYLFSGKVRDDAPESSGDPENRGEGAG